MKKLAFIDELNKLSHAARVELAKAQVSKLTERVVEVVNLAAVCDHFVYSNSLSGQIPRSYAGHAYEVTQQALFRQLIIRIIALWEKPELNSVSIPTVTSLINSDEIISGLQAEHFQAHAGQIIVNLNPSKDLEIEAAIESAIKIDQNNFATSRANQAAVELRQCIEKVKEVTEDATYKSINNLRHHLAHSLDKTRSEIRAPVPHVKYGQEKELLETSIRLIETLYCWVNATSFDIQGDCVEQAKRNASELWTNCTFNVPAH